MDLIPEVLSTSGGPGGYTDVTLKLSSNKVVPRDIQLLRARGRAMVTAGVADVAGNTARQVSDAVRNLSLSEIERATEIISDDGQKITVRVK